MLQNLRWDLDVARLETVEDAWRTEKFRQVDRIVSYNRLYFPLEGEGEVSHGGVTYHLRRGFIYLLPAFTPSRVRSFGALTKYWCNFNVFLAGAELDLFSVARLNYELPVENHEFFVELFRRMVQSYHVPVRAGVRIPEADRIESTGALMLLVHPFLKSIHDFDSAVSGGRRRFIELLYYIEQNLEGDLSLEKLAGCFHLNPTYLSNRFAAEMGLPLIRYCNNRRLVHALRLLADGKETIAEIAYRLGEHSPGNFTRLFKRHFKCSPREFRKRSDLGLHL